ncbi:hypothetical protein [Legionella steigerwaltii]|nr:hypothetical protein [Legionella steigerwaltii]
MKQVAAEQRVKFSLENADSDTLIGILTTDFTDNGKLLRDYLESKSPTLRFNLNGIRGWTPTANEDILTKDSLTRIKTEAANKLLLKLMATPRLNDPKLFDALITAHANRDIGGIKTAAKALATAGGIPLAQQDKFADSLALELSTEIIDKAKAQRKVLNDNANALLLELVSKPELKNLQLFKDLKEAYASNDPVKLQRTAKAIVTELQFNLQAKGLTPDTFANALTIDGGGAAVDTKAKEREKALLDEKAIAEFERQLQVFESNAKAPVLLALKDMLKKGPEDFFTDLAANMPEDPSNKYKDRMGGLTREQKEALGKKHQQRLCEKYLKAKISGEDIRLDSVNLANALKATDKDLLKTSVDLIIIDPDDKTITGKALTEGNVAAIKVELTKNIIGKIGRTAVAAAPGPDPSIVNLKALQNSASTSNVASFRKTLAEKFAVPGVTFDFLKKDDLPALTKAVNEQAEALNRKGREKDFKDGVKEFAKARLGENAHKQLVEIFKKLPDAKQNELLKKKAPPATGMDIDRQKVDLLMSLQTEAELKSHLETTDSKGDPLNFDLLLAENERAALLRQIRNPEVAKVLAGRDDALTQDKIDQINTALLNRRHNPGTFDITTAGNYKFLIDDIATALGKRNDDPFYQAFNLQAHNNNTPVDAALTSISAKIQGTHVNNQPLFAALADATPWTKNGGGLSPTQKKFVEILARVEGTHTLTTRADGTTYTMSTSVVDTPLHNNMVGIKQIYQAFYKSTNVHGFLDTLIPNASTDPAKTMKEQLSREFTPEVFRELKAFRIEAHFDTNENMLETIEGINKDLKALKKTTSTIEKHKGYLKELNDELSSLPILYNAANEANAKHKAQEMIGKYSKLAKESATIIEHLENAKLDLKVRIEKTPIPADDGTEARKKVIAEITKLHEALNEEIENIDEQLEFYKGLKQQINGEDGALRSIEKLMKRQATVVSQSDTIVYSEITKGQEKTVPIPDNPGASVGMTGLTTNVDDDTPRFKLLDVPKEGKVLGVDIVHVKENPDGTTGTESKARVTIDYHPITASNPKLVGKEVKGDRALTVSLAVPATDSNYLAEQCMITAKKLLQDWDGKSKILLNGKSGAASEKHLKYLWTAVNLLGEYHDPKVTKNDIAYSKKNTCAWRHYKDPQTDWKGSYTADSVYNKVFKGTASGLVDAQIAEFKALVDTKKKEKLEKAAEKGTQHYRSKMTEGRPVDIETTATKNIAVQGSQESRSRAPSLGGGGDGND